MTTAQPDSITVILGEEEDELSPLTNSTTDIPEPSEAPTSPGKRKSKVTKSKSKSNKKTKKANLMDLPVRLTTGVLLSYLNFKLKKKGKIRRITTVLK